MADPTIVFEQLTRHWHLALGARARHVRYGRGQSVYFLDLKGQGTLPPVVLLHGLSASGTSQYGPLIRRLRPHVSRIVLPDLPGHGASSLPSGGLEPQVMIDGLTAALDAAEIGGAVVFASSMAGGVAVRYAMARADRLRGLMLCSPSGAPIEPADAERFVERFRLRSHRDALAFVDRLFPTRNPLRHVYAWGVRQQFSRPHLVDLIERAPRMPLLEPEDLSSLTMPIYLLWGKADRILPESHFAFYRTHLPADAVIDRPHGFGHAPFLHRSAAVADRLLRFSHELAARRVMAAAE